MTRHIFGNPPQEAVLKTPDDLASSGRKIRVTGEPVAKLTLEERKREAAPFIAAFVELAAREREVRESNEIPQDL